MSVRVFDTLCVPPPVCVPRALFVCPLPICAVLGGLMVGTVSPNSVASPTVSDEPSARPVLLLTINVPVTT